MQYLYGPGKENEHTNPHLLAGSYGLREAFGGQLDRVEVAELSRTMNTAWREQFREQLAMAGGAPAGGISSEVLAVGGGPEGLPEAEKQAVYHMIVSLPPGQEWTEEQWASIADDVMQGMGFTDGPEDLAGARWAAVHHGRSGADGEGNDHIHIAASLVRQDGRRVRLPAGKDRLLSQQVRRSIEQNQERDFVLPLQERGAQKSLPAFTMPEHQQSRERGRETGKEVPDRVLLQQMVRAAATGSRTEAEFVTAFRDNPGAPEMVAAHWQRDTVTGYTVRLGPDGPWFSASSLSRGLTLGQLRPGWAANETPESREAARALWDGEGSVARETPPAGGEPSLERATQALDQWSSTLERLPPASPEWDQHLADAAGVVSTLAVVSGPRGEQFAYAGHTLSRLTAQQPRPTPERAPEDSRARPLAPGAPNAGDRPGVVAARQLSTAVRASSPSASRGWLAVLTQLRRTLAAIAAAREATQRRAQAQAIRSGAVEVVDAVHHDLSAARDLPPDAVEAQQMVQHGASRAPVPERPLTSTADRPRTATPGQDGLRPRPRRSPGPPAP